MYRCLEKKKRKTYGNTEITMWSLWWPQISSILQNQQLSPAFFLFSECALHSFLLLQKWFKMLYVKPSGRVDTCKKKCEGPILSFFSPFSFISKRLLCCLCCCVEGGTGKWGGWSLAWPKGGGVATWKLDAAYRAVLLKGFGIGIPAVMQWVKNPTATT